MSNDKDANAGPDTFGAKPYVALGAGRLSAALWKEGDETRGWRYRFNLIRISKADGSVVQWFSPRDVGDLARLVRLLAFTLADDGCVDDELRDDLACLAACLDEVLPPESPCRPRARKIDGEAAKALHEVLDYLWEDEARHFASRPASDHIYPRLVVLERWLHGAGAGSAAPLGAKRENGRLGLCPLCGKTDGRLNVERDHWLVCHAHRLRWPAGANRFPDWKEETPERWLRNWERIRDYREVQPCYPNSSQDER